MIQRYLGNKNSLAEYILREVDKYCRPGDLVCDIFSGTISMSMALKKRGYRVISNDISVFSYHFANCYLRNNSIPDFNLPQLGIDATLFNTRAIENLALKEGDIGFNFLKKKGLRDVYKDLAVVLLYLENIEENDIAEPFRHSYIYDT